MTITGTNDLVWRSTDRASEAAGPHNSCTAEHTEVSGAGEGIGTLRASVRFRAHISNIYTHMYIQNMLCKHVMCI